jgi:hypothetical protein
MRDLDALPRGDLDGFEQKLRQVIADYVGAEYGQYVKTSDENMHWQV